MAHRAPLRPTPIISIAQRTSLIDAEWDNIALGAPAGAKPAKPARRRARVLLTLACALATSSALAATAATLSRDRAIAGMPRQVALAQRSAEDSGHARTVSAPDERAETTTSPMDAPRAPDEPVPDDHAFARTMRSPKVSKSVRTA